MKSLPFLFSTLFFLPSPAQGLTALKAESVKDGSGKDWPLAKKPITVASSFLAGDEILIELVQNSQVKLVAVSSLADDREYSNIVDLAKQVPHRIGANPESIAKTRPDLVFMASWNRPDLYRTLSKLGIETFTISSFESINDIEANILLMGKVLHLESKAAQIVESMKQKMPMAAKRNLSFITFDPSGVSLGQNTIFNSLLSRLGLNNSVEQSGWPKLSRESIARKRPDLIFTSGESGDQEPTQLLLERTPGWKLLNAVKSRNIFLIPNRLLSCASQFVVSAYSHVEDLLRTRLELRDLQKKSVRNEDSKKQSREKERDIIEEKNTKGRSALPKAFEEFSQ